MKNIFNNIQVRRTGKLLSAVVIVASVFSCTRKYEDYNTNPYKPTREQMDADGYAVGKNFPVMINAVIPAGDAGSATDYVNSYQVAYNLAGDVFSGFMGQAGDWGGNTNNLTYGFNLGWVNEQFSLTGKLMAAWKNIKNISEASGDSLQFSVAQVIKITGISKTTDSYGPIPYTAIETGTFTPAYDRQDVMYYSFISELDRAIRILYTYGAGGGKSLQGYDLIYAGDYLKWAKYANSLKLRLAMRMAYADPTRAKQFAEEAANHPAGLISTIGDNAMQGLKPGNGSFNYKNPLPTLCVNYGEARMGAAMESFLIGYNDPRIAVYFKAATLPGNTSAYAGIRTGINVTRSRYQPFSQLNIADNDPLPWMKASEVYFLRAEGAIRQWNMNGRANELYEAGIRAAFEEVGTALPVNYLANSTGQPANYEDAANKSNNIAALTGITIAWNDGAPFEEMLERIITQKWIALFPNGQEAWTEFRRTGYPKLFPVALNRSGGTVNSGIQVRRLPYPLAQYQQNGEQVTKALSYLGGPDNGGTKLWWDKKK